MENELVETKGGEKEMPGEKRVFDRAPFLRRLVSPEENKNIQEIYAVFEKKKKTLRIMAAIRKYPSTKNVLEEMCAEKAKFRDKETVKIRTNVSSIIANKLPRKEDDFFTLSYEVGDFSKSTQLFSQACKIILTHVPNVGRFVMRL